MDGNFSKTARWAFHTSVIKSIENNCSDKKHIILTHTVVIITLNDEQEAGGYYFSGLLNTSIIELYAVYMVIRDIKN